MLEKFDLEKSLDFFDCQLYNRPQNFLPKTIVNLRGDKICSERIVVMPAQIEGIGECVKTLYVDDKKNKRVGILECFFENGEQVSFDGNLITTLRTIIITTLVIKKLNMLFSNKICVVGKNGRIGSALLRILKYYNSNVYGVGKNDSTIDDCDVLISCSSNYYKSKLRKLRNVRIVILLDSGYQFFIDAEKYEIYGDNIKSLNKNKKFEFPFFEMANFEKSIFSPDFLNSTNNRIACIVGDGVYDLLMAYLIIYNGIDIKNKG